MVGWASEKVKDVEFIETELLDFAMTTIIYNGGERGLHCFSSRCLKRPNKSTPKTTLTLVTRIRICTRCVVLHYNSYSSNISMSSILFVFSSVSLRNFSYTPIFQKKNPCKLHPEIPRKQPYFWCLQQFHDYKKSKLLTAETGNYLNRLKSPPYA